MTRTKKLIITFSVMVTAIVALILVLTLPERQWAESVNKEMEEKVTVTVRAVGDNLIHSPVWKSCKTDDGYNFDSVYENISPHIKDADIAAVNQETVFVDESWGYSGYPSFGVPKEVGESLIGAGFNVITHATNHSYDRGLRGITYTMDFWKNYAGVIVLGVNDNPEKQQQIDVFKKGDLSIAMLNFTDSLNGYTLPEDKPYLVNRLSMGEIEKNLLSRAEQTADITIVFVHFGTEYTHKPTEKQKEMVEFLCSNGADIIIGTHPHVVQPYTKHTAENGNEAVVFYSLGNFVSNQGGIEKVLCAMADIKITKENGVVSVESYKMHPVVTHCSDGKYSAYMLDDYTDDLALRHTRAKGITVEKLKALYEKILSVEI